VQADASTAAMIITNAIAARRMALLSSEVWADALRVCDRVRRLVRTGFDDDGPVDDYELIDAGGGARLERFGAHVTDRPHGGAYGERRAPERWEDADLRFDRKGGWSGPAADAARDGWTAEIGGLDLELRPTEAGQVGCFPEHAAMLPWLRERAELRRSTAPADAPAVRVLHLFAYTGLVTLAMAAAGATVAHVDAAKPAVAWARRNAATNGLAEAPIRWLVDDARAFAARERRRGNRYDGIVLDPPTYGHGASGRAWRLESDLDPLLDDCRALLSPDGFVLLTAHTEHLGDDALAARLGRALRRPPSGIEAGDLRLEAASGASLGLGAYARWDGAR
jgi:23S rRNA (cytosine1962-C5)-methyltransferase